MLIVSTNIFFTIIIGFIRYYNGINKMLYIRPININDDFERYLECVGELNGKDMSISNAEQMKRNLMKRSGNTITYIITIDNIIVSTATVIFETKLRYNQPCCHIEDVGVHPSHRKEGYGKMIVDHCIGEAKAKKCYKIKLCCSDKNVGFYSKLGFEMSANGMEKVLTKIR